MNFKHIISAIFLVGASFLTGCGVEVVETGNRGVKVNLGEVVGEPLVEGIYFYNPITTDIKELSVREEKWESKTEAFSKDAQVIHMSFALNLRPNPDKIHILYKNMGYNYQDVLVPQVVMQHLKEVTGKYIATDLIPNRELVRLEVKNKIEKEMVAKDIIIVDFAINDIDFDEAFKAAIENKVVATQRAEEAKNKTVQVREEASQKIIAAQSEAQAMRIKADALTQNKNLIEYESLSVQRAAIEKWNGTLPVQMLGKTMPFLKVNAE